MAPTKNGLDELTQFAKEIIRHSGKEALLYYGKGNPDSKFDEGLITEAEIHLTELFQNQLHAQFPEHQIFNNNQGNKDYTHEDKRYLWIHDALDGAANFQAGIPTWGISLALLENFWPIFGIFYMPATGDLFYAYAGKKAFHGENKICVSTQESINNESLLLTFSRFHNYYHSTFPGKIRDFGCTSAHICYVAAGRAEAAIIANETYQNLVAAQIVVEAAGGKIIKMDGNVFFLNEYLEEQKIDDHLLVISPEMFSQIRGYLNKK